MAQANVDLGVFQETKLTDGIYTRWSSDYHVHATDAPSTHQGGVALIYRDSDLFQVEAMDLHKAYDAMDRERALEILRGYGVGPVLCVWAAAGERELLQVPWTLADGE